MFQSLGPFGMGKRTGHNEKTDRQALCPHTRLDHLEILWLEETENQYEIMALFEQWTEF